jgi:hypothetical protein
MRYPSLGCHLDVQAILLNLPTVRALANNRWVTVWKSLRIICQAKAEKQCQDVVIKRMSLYPWKSKELLLFRERPHIYADITPVSPVRQFCESRPFQPRLFSKKPSSNTTPKQDCPPNPNTTSQHQVPPILTPDPKPHASNPKCQTPNPNTPTFKFQTPSPD